MNQPGDTGQTPSGPGFEHAVATSLSWGVILIDGEAKTATLSPEARQVLGFAAAEDQALALERLPSALVQIGQEAMNFGKPTSARQVSLGTGDTFINVSAIPVTGKSSHCVILILHSLNSTGQFLQQILQLDRLANMGTLAAGMAHEIKNALVASRTFLDLLLEKNSDEELVQIVRRETGRIDGIVSRMLRFAGSASTNFGPLHVHEILDHALRLVQPQLESKSISLERTFRAAPDLVNGDEDELQQAFVNLLLNALEAMSAGAQLTVRTENSAETAAGQSRLLVTVQDTGAGILPEHMPHLFQPFFTTKASGTGLGLATTRRIIQEHGGSIAVQSSPGHGTTFSIVLPQMIDDGSGAETGRSGKSSKGNGGFT